MLLLGLLRRSERTWHGLALSGQSIQADIADDRILPDTYHPQHLTRNALWAGFPETGRDLRIAALFACR